MDELEIEYQVGGSPTFKRQELGKGFEPDECFWIANRWRSPEHPTYDPQKDPPPDLTIEIEISRSAIDRMEIFRALGVGEVWRWSSKGLRVYRLNDDGIYELSLTSPTFPSLPLGEMDRLIREGARMQTSQMKREFRTWIRENLK